MKNRKENGKESVSGGGGGSSIPVLKEIQINMIDYIYNRISTAT